MGPADHQCPEGQSRICTVKARDKHDYIIVQEKVDGTCVAISKTNGSVLPLIRAGYPAVSSDWPQHRMFAEWVFENYKRFDEVLTEGERLVSEWLAQAHGTRYNLPHEPLVVFDLMVGHQRASYDTLVKRVQPSGFVTPRLIHRGGPLSIEAMLQALEPSGHGAIDPVEGAVWRVERKGQVDFLAKYVRPDKVDGIYLPEQSGREAVWNWKPNK